ncbi:hypothetical protein F0562_008405 [Nyssa sinensis]|uniref:Pentacotripeptide-repeat region of PRORP domain-containing protein n=1 Tax=Nyssa sinensis TaxID=561372 RepID=A0A5J5A918_9ASTE|nr:hypothetical protein F0562_008405 [Nyssa sinensis]
MMRVLHSCISSNSWCGRYDGISRVCRVLLHSTQTLNYSASNDTLYGRISPAGDHRVSIVPILDQWVQEGRAVNKDELKTAIKLLRKYRRFSHALQLSEWMSDRRSLDLLPGDVAVRLDLVSKVHGLEQAEKFFNSIPNTMRTYHVYGALLNCYAHEKSLEKAEAVMQKIRELGLLRISLSYNVMLNLYSKMGKHEKLDTLMQEMEEKGMGRDKPTLYIRLTAYGVASNIEGMEKLLMWMEADPLLAMDWNTYVIAANGYSKAGLVEKSLEMLKKSEQHISSKRRGFAYEILLTLYASLANKDDVYRIWDLRKKVGKIYNMGYFRMVSSLVKLDDIDGAEKILEEWESVNTSFDFRIPNLLINAYCKKGLLEKAEAFVSIAIERGKEPTVGTWDCLATGYYKDNQMAKAVDTMRKAILANPRGWKLNRVTLTACLEYLKKNGDVDVSEEFTGLIGKWCHFSESI